MAGYMFLSYYILSLHFIVIAKMYGLVTFPCLLYLISF